MFYMNFQRILDTTVYIISLLIIIVVSSCIVLVKYCTKLFHIIVQKYIRHRERHEQSNGRLNSHQVDRVPFEEIQSDISRPSKRINDQVEEDIIHERTKGRQYREFTKYRNSTSNRQKHESTNIHHHGFQQIQTEYNNKHPIIDGFSKKTSHQQRYDSRINIQAQGQPYMNINPYLNSNNDEMGHNNVYRSYHYLVSTRHREKPRTFESWSRITESERLNNQIPPSRNRSNVSERDTNLFKHLHIPATLGYLTPSLSSYFVMKASSNRDAYAADNSGVELNLYTEDKHNVERNTYTENKPFLERNTFTEDKPSVERNTFTEDKPFLERNTFTEDKPSVESNTFTEDKPFLERNTFTGDKPSVERHTFIEDKPDVERNTFTEDKPFLERNTFTEDEPDVERNTFTDDKPSVERNTFTDGERTAHTVYKPDGERTTHTVYKPDGERTTHTVYKPDEERTAHTVYKPDGERTAHTVYKPDLERTAHTVYKPDGERTAHTQDKQGGKGTSFIAAEYVSSELQITNRKRCIYDDSVSPAVDSKVRKCSTEVKVVTANGERQVNSTSDNFNSATVRISMFCDTSHTTTSVSNRCFPTDSFIAPTNTRYQTSIPTVAKSAQCLEEEAIHKNNSKKNSIYVAANLFQQAVTEEFHSHPNFSSVDIPEVILSLSQSGRKGPIHTVVFDLETTGLGNYAEIVQLAAQKQDDHFNKYIVPTRPINREASEITGLYTRDGTLYHNDRKMKTERKMSCLNSFIDWLPDNTILCAHNCKQFDAIIIVSEVTSVNLMTNFKRKVIGFIDTLPLFKANLPGRKSYKQTSLVTDVLGETYEAHEATDDTRLLLKLLTSKNVPLSGFFEHSFTIESVEKYLCDFKRKKDSLRTFKKIIEAKAMSKSMAEKAAKTDLRFNDLILAAKGDNVDGLFDLLSKPNESDGKPRLTKSTSVITKIYEFIKSME